MLFLMYKNIEMENAAWVFFQVLMIDSLYFNKLKLAYGTLYNSETVKIQQSLAQSLVSY
jgi:hypothetical protein